MTLLPLPTPQEMAAWDREAIHGLGIPGMVLMENAAREAVRVLADEAGPLTGKTIYLFAGSGNNGGDAFAMARILLDRNATVAVFHTKPKKEYRGETRTNLQLAQKLGIPLFYLASANLDTLPQPDIIVDGLLGTGFSGELRKDFLRIVRRINSLGERAFVFCIDIPSGLNGMSGRPGPEAVRADATVTFQAAKTGLAMPEASKWIGNLHTVDIGLPSAIQSALPVRRFLMGPDTLAELPTPSANMHKGTAGHVLILGGSPGMSGAPKLAALGALRAGAGLATIGAPETILTNFGYIPPEIMTLPLPGDGKWSPEHFDAIEKKLAHFKAVVVGPGMGRDRKTVDFLFELVARCPLPMVFDADALNNFADCPDLLTKVTKQCVLTPHPGEMGRLCNKATTEIQQDRLKSAEDFTKKTNATIVLKGAATIVADARHTCLSPFSVPQLAVAGSGDVLSGVIGALLAAGIPAWDAARLGVFWHGAAGSLLQRSHPMRGNLAHEIADTLPQAAKEFGLC